MKFLVCSVIFTLLLATTSAADDSSSRIKRSVRAADWSADGFRMRMQRDQAAADDEISEVVANSRRRICSLEPSVGPCRALFTRWHYDRTTQSCQTFTYGGCRGNGNNFIDETSCMRYCTAQPTSKLSKSKKSQRN